MIGIFLVSFCLFIPEYHIRAWVPSAVILRHTTSTQQRQLLKHSQQLSQLHQSVMLFSAPPTDSNKNEEKDVDEKQEEIKRTTFDEAGKSLIDEEDVKRMEAMGDFDLNPDAAKQDSIERMRAAIRARTADLGIEKSKVSAKYIEDKQKMAIAAGSAKAASEQTSQNTFAGLDLSQISDGSEVRRRSTPSVWGDDEEDTPSMFYDPEDKLSEEEKVEIDPYIKKGIIEQGLNELKNAKWPDWLSALREVALMAVVVAATAALIIGWDKLLRTVYTDILHFVPTKEELANYAARFDGLDLPKGWINNMSEADVAKLAETVNVKSAVSSKLPGL